MQTHKKRSNHVTSCVLDPRCTINSESIIGLFICTLLTRGWQAGWVAEWSQVFWVVASAGRTVNHQHIQPAFMAHLVVISVTSVPRHLAPAAPRPRRLVISHTQYQTKAAFTTCTQHTLSTVINTRPRLPSPPAHNTLSAL